MKDAGCPKKICATDLQAELVAFIIKHDFYCKIANRWSLSLGYLAAFFSDWMKMNFYLKEN